MFSSYINSSSVNNSIFLTLHFWDQNWNRNILINRDFMSDRDSNVIVLVVWNSVCYLMINSSRISLINRTVVNSLSSSVNRSSLLQLYFSFNLVHRRISNLLGINSSSRNSIVHRSVSLSSLNRKCYNFLWMSYSRRIYKS